MLWAEIQEVGEAEFFMVHKQWDLAEFCGGTGRLTEVATQKGFNCSPIFDLLYGFNLCCGEDRGVIDGLLGCFKP